MTIMLTAGEQQELRQVERGLRDADPALAWRLAVLQGMLRWSGPGRRAYLPVLPVLALLAAVLLRLAAGAGRLLVAFAEGGMLMGPPALMALGDARWPGWEMGQGPRHGASPAQGRPRPDEPGPR